ncbi:unnamed protein product [Mytilus coruscus]|uniref:Uncharacterized protein n=1 Tax=Mytilus coruscus TaxID=42192 RepID=A0A6J8ATZ5_MYTCO|nr:unnamed protein product [Mytilus coruscus]
MKVSKEMDVKQEEKTDKTLNNVDDNAKTVGEKPHNDKSDEINKHMTVDSSGKLVTEINIPMLEEDLGIYDDPGECDGLSDTDMVELDRVNEMEKIQRNKTPQEEKSEPTPVPILRKSSQLGNSYNIRNMPSGYRAVANTPATHSELDIDQTSVTWSAQTKQPIGVYISTKHRKSGNRLKLSAAGSSLLTRTSDLPGESRATSRVASESREAMFRRAMALLSARCTSVLGSQTVETPFGTVKQPTFGIQVPQYFYIKQEKPRPMPPLKAWQGYNGNVYFEPISIAGMPNDVLMPKSGKSRGSHVNDQVNRMTPGQKRPMTEPNRSPDSSSNSRSISRNTGKSNNSKNRPSTRQMALLDKRTVLNRFNTSLDDDITLIETTETTGSLAVRPKSDNIIDYKTRHDQMYNRERICKGSVAHKQYIAKMQGNRPSLKVSGGKYSTPAVTSPLLRTQTQYSLSNNRLTTNSPDLYAAQLPPLEQLRNSVRHMDNTNEKQNYGRARPLTNDIKPFIKYSPDIKIKQPAVNYV